MSTSSAPATTREGDLHFHNNPARDPFTIFNTGWYTFQDTFSNAGGVLSDTLAIKNSGGTVLHQWILSDPSDLIAGIGGNDYGWFVAQEFPFLAFDNTFRQDSGGVEFFQGFETDTTEWNLGVGKDNATRVASGTHGVTSKTGNFHAEAFGPCDADVCGGSTFTHWGGDNSTFPTGGYTTSLDIFLDTNAITSNDIRFDFSSAINDNAGNFHRDFVFNAGGYQVAIPEPATVGMGLLGLALAAVARRKAQSKAAPRS